MIARTWIIDLDGVIWNGSSPVPGSADAVATLRRRGDRVVFATNHSSPTRQQLRRQLARHGIEVGDDEIRTSADAAASLVARGERVLAFAGPGVREAVTRQGATIVPDATADTVVLGWHAEFGLQPLTTAVRVVMSGARLVATNDDLLRPCDDGVQPGAGAMLAAVEAATGRTAMVAGKPHPPMAGILAPLIDGEVIVVGDSAATDGELARVLGAPFALVLSGITTQPPPDCSSALVAADLASVVARAAA